MNLTTLTDLLLNEMCELLDAERQLVSVLPVLAKSAFSAELKGAFDLNASQTKNQVVRLESAFLALGVQAQERHCLPMAGLVGAAQGLLCMQDEADANVFDAALITAVQKMEHYEMAAYGSARNFARRLGVREVEALLQATLDEEAEADRKLTQIAEGAVNPRAAETEVRRNERIGAPAEASK